MANILRVGGGAGSKPYGEYVWRRYTIANEAMGEFVDYVTDNDINKYPTSGMQDGYWYEAGSGGKYLWKKFDYCGPDNTDAAITVTSVNSSVANITSDNVDLTTVEASFFDGFVATNENMYFTYSDGQLWYNGSTNPHKVTWDSAAKTMTFSPNISFSGIEFSYNKMKSAQYMSADCTFVTSSNPDAYPSESNVDGQWYEATSAVSGCIASGNTTSGSMVITIPEGYDMSKIAVVAKSMSNPAHATISETDRTVAFAYDSIYYEIYYFPWARKIYHKGLTVNTSATTATTKFDKTKSLILFEELNFNDYFVSFARSKTSMTMYARGSTTYVTYAEVVF